MTNSFLSLPAIKVSQPLGEFFITSIKAKDLLALCYSAPAESVREGLGVEGTQRIESGKRLHEIAEYIQTYEAAFPNSIILGANYDSEGNYVVDESAWRIEKDGNIYSLIIPTVRAIASIIDGQHRLMAFKHTPSECRDIELLCSVYLDLPVPYHAYIFSTINFNQKKVDKSLAYNLFGFDIENSRPEGWSPETIAVSFSRRLNNDSRSPFFRTISLGVIESDREDIPVGEVPKRFNVSMATVVDGILKLISKNPKKDRTRIMKHENSARDRKLLGNDGSPLRVLYVGNYDEAIYEVIINYFIAVTDTLWSRSNPDSYIFKTVGIQALFDVLAHLLKNFDSKSKVELADFMEKLSPLAGMTFEDAQASGIGRSTIKNKILAALQASEYPI